MSIGFAVLVDIVRSREMENPERDLERIESTLAAVNDSVVAAQPLEPTIGDEFQGAYGSIYQALLATTLVRLTLPDSIECRFGIGYGEYTEIGESRIGLVQHGPAWWTARAAIDHARALEYGDSPWLRSWFESEGRFPETELVNSVLVCRDELISGLSANSRHVVAGAMSGLTQAEIAQHLDISQPAVSKSLKRPRSAALLSIVALLRGAIR